MTTGRRWGTYAVMAWLAELDLTVMWGSGRSAAQAASTSRAILQTIANFVDETNSAHPGNENISRQCDNVSLPTIKRHLKRAREVGLITTKRTNLGTRRGKDIISFHVDLTQEQLVSNSSETPHRRNEWKPSTEVPDPSENVTGAHPAAARADERVGLAAELVAEVERLRAELAAARSPENRQGITVIPWDDSAGPGPEGITMIPSEGITGDTFRRDHGRSLPIRTIPVNQDSSSSSSSAVPSTLEDEEEDDEPKSDDGMEQLATRLSEIHPRLELGRLLRRCATIGVDAGVRDLVGAATDILSKAPGAVHDPVMYVAAGLARDLHHWPAVSQDMWEQALATPPAPRMPAAGHPDWSTLAVYLGITATPGAITEGQRLPVEQFVIDCGGWNEAVTRAVTGTGQDDEQGAVNA